MPFTLLLAWRFLKASRSESAISTMVKICFLSIAVGTGALTLVAAIMNGFEKATHKKLQGIHADLTMNAHDKAINYEKVRKVIAADYANSICAISPTSHTQLVLQNRAVEPHETQIGLLKAVDPREESSVSSLKQMLTAGSWESLEDDRILIGALLADRLRLRVGDILTLVYPQQDESNKVSLEEQEVTVGGLFKTGIHDFDEHIVLTSLAFAQKWYGAKITQVTIKLKDPAKEQAIRASLEKRFHLDVYSWKDLYPPLVSALTLEKYAMFFILALVTLVASLNIISLLFMYATQKRNDIALLKAMGMSSADLMTVFILLSTCITMSATFCGILIASLATWLLNCFPFIRLPDVYYVTHLPALLDVRIIISVVLLALFVSLFAALLPLSKIKSMNIANVLKGLPQ